MSRSLRILVVPVLCLVAGFPAFGQATRPVLGGVPAASDAPLTGKAVGIVQYDDGESDVGYVDPGRATTELAMLFDNVGGPDVTLGSVDVCLYQTGADPKIRYEVVVWAADGPGGAPGTELATEAAVATGVTSTATFDSTTFNFPLTETNVYIGVRWHPIVDPAFAFCVDRDGIGGAVQPGYYRANETGAWAPVQLAYSDPDYNALMFRAVLFTPGVVVENLLVPFFRVDTTDPAGTTTLFAVRNLTDAHVSAGIEYFTVQGVSQRIDDVMLGPHDTVTVNVRDIPGLATAMDGFSRGYVEISTAGNPDMTPVLAGDFFQVDVGNDFATGDRLVRQIQLCTDASVRVLKFPLPGSGTVLKVWLTSPRGNGGGDPPSFTVQAYDEDGNAVGAPIPVKTGNHALAYDAATFSAGLAFGTLHFDFSNSGGGMVYAESSVQGRFSVGVTAQCDEMP